MYTPTHENRSPTASTDPVVKRNKDSLLFLLACMFFASMTVFPATPVDSLRHALEKASGKAKIPIYLALAEHFQVANPELSIDYNRKGCELAASLHDTVYAARLLVTLGYTYGIAADYPNAVRKAHEAYALFLQAKDSAGMADAHSTLGIVYGNMGQYVKALEEHMTALTLREKIGLTYFAMSTRNNIGIVYHKLGQYDMALEYYAKTLEYRRVQGDTMPIIIM